MNTIKTENKIEIKPGYKKTPVGMIPEDWEVKKLKNISQIVGGFAFKSRDFVDYGKYQVVKMSNVYQGVLDLERSKSFLNKLTDREKEYLLIQGDILISLTGTVGKKDYGYTILINEEDNLLLNQRLAKIVVNKTTNCSYLFYCLKTSSFLRQFFNSSRGGTGNQANVSVVDLGKTNLPIPPLPEQKAIADCLSTWDKGIEKLSALIASKKEQKKGLMQQLLTGKKRLDGFTEEWKEVELKDVGFVPQKQAVTKIGDRRTLTVRLYANGVDFNDNAKTRITSSGRNYYVRETNEILIGRQNIHNGGVGLVKPEHDGHICSNAITSYSVNENNNLFFLLYLLSFPCIYRPIERYMTGTGQKELSEKQFLDLSFKIPKLDEQNAIAKVLNAAEKEVELLEKKLETFKTQKKGLMQVLLTGEKRLV